MRRLAGSRTACPALVLAAALLAASARPATAQAAQEEPPRTTLDGVYTGEQAARGRQLYQRTCSRCHALDWYTGDVVRAWEGAPLFALFDVISTKMPEDNPGSLRRTEYVDMLAYILELNGMPAGDRELSTGASRLRAILFRWRDEP
jgi:mono/diheme cytochrome c family protein